MRIRSLVLGLVATAALLARAAPAAELRLKIVPDRDPDGRLWDVELAAEEPLASGSTAVDGTWRKLGLPPKEPVRVTVKTAAGETWWHDEEPVVLEEDVTERVLTFEIVRVKGTLSFGGGPLRAALRFDDARLGSSLLAHAEKDGTFRVALPRRGNWDVTVTAKRPRLNAAVRTDVWRDRDLVCHADVALDSPGILGEVVDERGRAVPAAAVWFGPRFDDREISTEPDGSFDLTFLPWGKYRVGAYVAGLVVEAADVESVARLGAPFVSLTARDASVIRGVVTAGSGIAVRGLELHPLPPPGLLLGERSERTDERGAFTLSVDPRFPERCVMLGPGGPIEVLRLPVQDEPQRVVAPAQAGALSLDGPAPKRDAPILLVRNGCAFSPWTAGIRGARYRTDKGRLRVTLPGVATGAWSLCVGTGDPARLDRCVPAEVSPGGAASATLP